MRKRLVFSLLVISLLSVVMGSYMLFELWWRAQAERTLRENMTLSYIWPATQNELELARLYGALADYAANPDVDNFNVLRLRMDLLWSRILVYQGGQLYEWLGKRPQAAQIIARMNEALPRIEADIHALEGGADPLQINAIGTRIRNLMPDLRVISVNALDEKIAHDNIQADLNANLFSGMIFVGLLAVVLICTLAVIVLLGARHYMGRITALCSARDSALDAYRFLLSAIGRAQDGFALCDADGRMRIANPRFREYLNLEEKSFRPAGTKDGAPCVEYNGPKVSLDALLRRACYQDIARDKSLDEKIRLFSSPGPGEERRIELRNNDGLWLSLSACRVGKRRLVCQLRDVSETRKQELALDDVQKTLRAQSDAMEKLVLSNASANRAKTHLLSISNHEILTPLNDIFGFTHLLENSLLDKRQALYVKNLVHSAERLIAIVDHLTAYSRIDTQSAESQEKWFAPHDLMAMLVKCGEAFSGGKPLRIRHDMQGEVPFQIWGDEEKIRQVMFNFIDNAAKFSEEGDIVLGAAFAQSGPGRQTVRLWVQDCGPGLDEAERALLMQSLSGRLGSGRQRGGLGLVMSWRMTRLMGGTIEMEGVRGKGSTFSLRLDDVPVRSQAPVQNASLPGHDAMSGGAPDLHMPPGTGAATAVRARGPQSKTKAFPLSSAQDGPLRILVAEDTLSSQLVISEMIKASGHEAVCVENGLQAVDAVQRGAFDLVLMDLQMPVMDGLAATRKIRSLEGDPSDTRIFALTAQTGAQDRQNGMAAGMNGYLTKPLRAAQLAHLIETVRIDNRSAGPPVPGDS